MKYLLILLIGLFILSCEDITAPDQGDYYTPFYNNKNTAVMDSYIEIREPKDGDHYSLLGVMYISWILHDSARAPRWLKMTIRDENYKVWYSEYWEWPSQHEIRLCLQFYYDEGQIKEGMHVIKICDEEQEGLEDSVVVYLE